MMMKVSTWPLNKHSGKYYIFLIEVAFPLNALEYVVGLAEASSDNTRFTNFIFILFKNYGFLHGYIYPLFYRCLYDHNRILKIVGE